MNRLMCSRSRDIMLLQAVLAIIPISMAVGQGAAYSGKDSASAGAVIAHASRLLGASLVPKGEALSDQTRVEIIRAVDSTTPFVAENINEKPVVLVSAPRVTIKPDRTICRDLTEAQFNVEVYFDSTSQKLLKIVLRSDSYDPSKIKKAQYLDADQQMNRTEHYHGLPDQEPLANLAQAMTGLSSCPLLATEIVAVYTMQTNVLYRDGKAHPSWYIFLYGSEAFGHGARLDAPLHMRNYFVYLVDAETGTCLIGTNVPAPDQGRYEIKR